MKNIKWLILVFCFLSLNNIWGRDINLFVAFGPPPFAAVEPEYEPYEGIEVSPMNLSANTRLMGQIELISLPFVSCLVGIGTNTTSASYRVKESDDGNWHQFNYKYRNLITEVGIGLNIFQTQLQAILLYEKGFEENKPLLLSMFNSGHGRYRRKTVILDAPGALALGLRLNMVLSDFILLGGELLGRTYHVSLQDDHLQSLNVQGTASLLAGITF